MALSRGLRRFATRMGQIADAITRRADRVQTRAAEVALEHLVITTPVDTGLARSNWQVGVGSAPEGVVGIDSVAGTIARGKSNLRGRRRNADVFIVNNVHYVGLLNAGSSRQQPAFFVERALAAAAQATSRMRLVYDLKVGF